MKTPGSAQKQSTSRTAQSLTEPEEPDLMRPTVAQQCCGCAVYLTFALLLQFLYFPNSGRDEVVCSFREPVSLFSWFYVWLVFFYLMAAQALLFIVLLQARQERYLKKLNSYSNPIIRTFCFVWNLIGIISYFDSQEFRCVSLYPSRANHLEDRIERIEELTLTFLVFSFFGVILTGCLACMACFTFCTMCVWGPETVTRQDFTKNYFVEKNPTFIKMIQVASRPNQLLNENAAMTMQID